MFGSPRSARCLLLPPQRASVSTCPEPEVGLSLSHNRTTEESSSFSAALNICPQRVLNLECLNAASLFLCDKFSRYKKKKLQDFCAASSAVFKDQNISLITSSSSSETQPRRSTVHAAYRDLHLRLALDADLSWQQKRTSGDRVTRDISFWDLISF